MSTTTLKRRRPCGFVGRNSAAYCAERTLAQVHQTGGTKTQFDVRGTCSACCVLGASRLPVMRRNTLSLLRPTRAGGLCSFANRGDAPMLVFHATFKPERPGFLVRDVLMADMGGQERLDRHPQ